MKKQWSLRSLGKIHDPLRFAEKEQDQNEEQKTNVENIHAISCFLSKCKYMTMAYVIYDHKPPRKQNISRTTTAQLLAFGSAARPSSWLGSLPSP